MVWYLNQDESSCVENCRATEVYSTDNYQRTTMRKCQLECPTKQGMFADKDEKKSAVNASYYLNPSTPVPADFIFN